MNSYLINLLMYCSSKHQIKIFLFISLCVCVWNGRRRSKWSEAELDVSRQSYQRWLNHKIQAPSSNSFGIIPISLGLVSIRVLIYCEEGKLQTGKFVNVKGEGVVVKWKSGEVKKNIYLFILLERKNIYIYIYINR